MFDPIIGDSEMLELIAITVETLARPLIVTDYETVSYANGAARDMLGATSADQVCGRPIREIVHPDGHEALFERRPILVGARQTVRGIHVKFRGVDGRIVIDRADVGPAEFDGRTCGLALLTTSAPHRSSSPDPSYHPDAALVAGLFDALPLPILIHDETLILAANAATLQLLGASSAEEVVGRPVDTIVHPDGVEAGRARRRLASEFGVKRFMGVPVKLLRFDGSDVRLEVDATTLAAGDRSVVVVTPSAP